jgi:DNA-directed RNA polymerase specialized sigma24 family protein
MGEPKEVERRPPEIHARLERVLAGDEEAKRWMFDAFAARLLRRLTRRYGRFSGIDPEDLLHDTYVACFDRRSHVLTHLLEQVAPEELGESRLEAHLWGVACGIASNRRRSIRRKREIDPAELPPLPPRPDPERAQVERDALAGLSGCLKRAGSRVYLYFKLRFVDGLTPAEIVRATRWSRKATYKLKLSLNEAVERCAARLGLI